MTSIVFWIGLAAGFGLGLLTRPILVAVSWYLYCRQHRKLDVLSVERRQMMIREDHN